MTSEKLYVQTPLIETLSKKHNFKVLLKLENTQPSGSFKIRGISEHCRKLKERGCQHFVSSSGGNAGLAVAFTGRVLNVPVKVFVPTTTGVEIIEKLRLEGATVEISGDVWDETNKHALDFVMKHNQEHAALVHPFDHLEIWEGHASIIHELKEQVNEVPDALVLSVGGGGLLCGVLKGLHDVGWTDVPVIACETEGADCFNAAMEAGTLVKLSKITSIAKCLGALCVVPKALDWSNKHTLYPIRVSDKEAVSSCLSFANDHRMLVQPACGAALTMLYSDKIETILSDKGLQKLKSIVLIVCGGSGVNINTLLNWKKNFEL